VRLTKTLLWLAAVALVATGIVYVAVPGAALGIVGIAASPTTEFLLRTQGVALIAAGVLLVLIPAARSWRTRFALLAVAGYLIVGSVVDLRAYLDGVVGAAALPSAVIRIAAGALCVLAAVARARPVPAAAASGTTSTADTAADTPGPAIADG
jgi:hypothetical protein